MKVEVLDDNNVEVVACPGCERERPAEPGKYVCSECGTWFRVSEE